MIDRIKKCAVVFALLGLSACGFGSPDSSAIEPDPSPEEAMYTPSSDGFHFLAIGDWGTGTETQYTLANRMCELRKDVSFDLVITAGDNVYDTGSRGDFRAKFYDPFDCLLRKQVQFRSTLGNHDVITNNGRPELNEPRFGMNGRNYVIQEGGVRFVMVDSNRIRKRWLRRALRPEEGDRWTIVVFHHPVYSSSSVHGSTDGFRFFMPPMFEKQGVDLVITAHTHVYAVTKPLHKIRYVTTGGGSGPLYDCTPHWYTERCIEKNHFLSIVAGADEISVAAIDPAGAAIDRFSTPGRD